MQNSKFPSAYEPSEHEQGIYGLWEEKQVFRAKPASQKPRFSISMPPPNETGTLHLGHALGTTLQDIMARHARMKGSDVLWLPGTDHAAIAVNAIIERQLAEQGTDKHQIGRQEFLRRTKEFVGDSRNNIIAQFKALGASADWSRTRYTLDEALNRCVSEVFVKMYDDGLIYRGHRIVNWDPKLETTVSDDEVEHKEEETTLYILQYGPFQIATARPETKFGDKYVVMHPDDKRYKQYAHGDTFEAEWINGPVKATVIKDEAIEMDFGTGVMTITPWHDQTDFDIAERHGLEKEQIIGFDGKLLPIAGEFAGLPIDEARPKIVDKLRAKGLLVKEDKYVHSLALNSRGKGLIEPQIKLQWFVDVNRPAVDWKGQLRSLKEVMRAVIEDGDIKITPKRFEKVYYHWIDNLRDWCVSRQIWWGHQIPVWYRGEGDKPETYVGVLPPEGDGWRQDPDTLDTWFSSALWTWSTLVDSEAAKDYSLSLNDILERSPDYRAYHPTSVMETGWDILFFWVARMILATTYATGQVPFKQVYLHGMVRTESGKKMSKSDPESMIDPLEIIPRYGSDALRLSLIAGTSAGSDLRLGMNKIVASRNFANKLWNIARYSESRLEAGSQIPEQPQTVHIEDIWILKRLGETAGEVDTGIQSFRFSEAYDSLYHFIWDDLADWYLEANKKRTNSGTLAYVLAATLKIAHPFAPFITEVIWQNLGWGKAGLLAEQGWPAVTPTDENQAAEFEVIKELVSEIRSVNAALQLKKPKLVYKHQPAVDNNRELVTWLGRLGRLETAEQGSGLKLTSKVEAWLDIERDKARDYLGELRQKSEQTEQTVKQLEGRLANSDYLSKAPSELVEQSRQQLEEERTRLEKLKKEVATFESLE